MQKEIRKIISESIEAKKHLYNQINNLEKTAEEVYKRISSGNKLLTFGNGGSAADAQHIAAELVGRFKRERRGLPAIALTTDTSYITAWSNDYKDGFERLFERQVEALAREGDALLGISTSGISENVLRAFMKGRELGTYNISLTGRDGGKLKELSDLNVNIPIQNTARIQEAHELAYHIICEIIDRKAYSRE